MNKLKQLVKVPQFWVYFFTGAVLIFALESLLLGMWTIPVINYQISYMNPVTQWDIAFISVFAILFGIGTALFFLMKKFSNLSCAVGSASGLATLFTLLCPVCPIFFLTYFGLSATIMFIAPYFWTIRLISLAILLIGTIILAKNLQIKKLPKGSGHLAFQKLSVIIIALIFINNQALATQIGHQLMGPQPGAPVEISGDFAKDIAALVTPNNVPFYGPELGLSFSSVEDINGSIAILSKMAPQQGSTPIDLNEEEMKRYVAIGTEPKVTCEFCCGVETLVREDGSPTCGCAHSIAMRGTAAYLIQNYPEMTNAEISYELMRQKGLYFPKQMQQRMATQLAGDTANFTPDIKYLTQNLTPSELTDLQRKSKEKGFIPQVEDGMVGGC